MYLPITRLVRPYSFNQTRLTQCGDMLAHHTATNPYGKPKLLGSCMGIRLDTHIYRPYYIRKIRIHCFQFIRNFIRSLVRNLFLNFIRQRLSLMRLQSLENLRQHEIDKRPRLPLPAVVIARRRFASLTHFVSSNLTICEEERRSNPLTASLDWLRRIFDLPRCARNDDSRRLCLCISHWLRRMLCISALLLPTSYLLLPNSELITSKASHFSDLWILETAKLNKHYTVFTKWTTNPKLH